MSVATSNMRGMKAFIPDQRFPLDQTGKQLTKIDPDSPECNTMVGVVRGRNDYNIAPPTEPGTPEFQHQCELLIEAGVAYEEGVWPADYFTEIGVDPEPTELARLFTIQRRAERGESVVFPDGEIWRELVNFVGMDKPLHWHEWLTDHIDYSIAVDLQPETCGIDQFHEKNWFNWVVAGAVHKALIESFQVKYYFAATRPSTDFPAGRLIESDPCPPHWRYPAGHGSFLGGTAEMWESATDSEYAGTFTETALQFAHARTGRRVHYPEDNTVGVELGQKVVRKG